MNQKMLIIFFIITLLVLFSSIGLVLGNMVNPAPAEIFEDYVMYAVVVVLVALVGWFLLRRLHRKKTIR